MSTSTDDHLASSLQALGSVVGSVQLRPVDHLGQVVQAAATVLGVTSVGLMLLDDHDQLRMVGVSDASSQAAEEAQSALGRGPGLDSVRTGATIAVSDLADAAEYAELWQLVATAGVRALLASPVRVDGVVVGTFNAYAAQPAEWRPRQVRATEAYARLVGSTLRLTARSQHAVAAVVGRDVGPRPPEQW